MHTKEIIEKLQQEIKNNNIKIEQLKKENTSNKIACLLLLFQMICFLVAIYMIFQSLAVMNGLFLASILTIGIIGGTIGIVKKALPNMQKQFWNDLKSLLKDVTRNNKKTIEQLSIKNSLIQKELEKAKKHMNSTDQMTLQHLLQLEMLLDEYIARKKYYRSKYHQGLLFTTNLNSEESSLMEEIVYEDIKIKTRGRLK